MNANLVKCHCNNCSEHIEFESDQAGTRATCPHCGLDTLLYIPSPEPKTAKKEKEPETPITLKSLKLTKPIIPITGIVILSLIGIALFVSGCVSDLDAKSAMQQTVGALQYCTGLIIIALAFILEALRTLNKNLKE